MQNPHHILVLRFSAMGDVAMIAPVIRALLEQYPDLKVTMVTRPFFVPIFKGLPNLKVIGADLKGEYKGIWGLYKLARNLKTHKIDGVADLHNVLRTKLLKIFFLGTPFMQINKGRSEKKELVTGRVFKPLRSTHQRYADVFKMLGFDVDLSKPTFPEPSILSTELKAFISNRHSKTIGIAPFAAHRGKMYPIAKMEQLIKELSNSYNLVLFGGGENEIKTLGRMESTYPNVSSVAGKLNFDDELKLMSNLDLMVSMDSGNAHLAAMLGLKVLTIWGVTHPYAGFTPFNQSETCSVLADRKQFPLIPTSVYGNKYPKDYEDAAGSIKPETIINKIQTMLA